MDHCDLNLLVDFLTDVFQKGEILIDVFSKERQNISYQFDDQN